MSSSISPTGNFEIDIGYMGPPIMSPDRHFDGIAYWTWPQLVEFCRLVIESAHSYVRLDTRRKYYPVAFPMKVVEAFTIPTPPAYDMFQGQPYYHLHTCVSFAASIAKKIMAFYNKSSHLRPEEDAQVSPVKPAAPILQRVIQPFKDCRISANALADLFTETPAQDNPDWMQQEGEREAGLYNYAQLWAHAQAMEVRLIEMFYGKGSTLFDPEGNRPDRPPPPQAMNSYGNRYYTVADVQAFTRAHLANMFVFMARR